MKYANDTLGRLSPSRKTKFSGTHGDREIFIFPVQLTTGRIGNLTWLIHTLLYVMLTIHTPRQTKFSRCFDASPGWDRSLPTVSALTMLDSMTPVFVCGGSKGGDLSRAFGTSENMSELMMQIKIGNKNKNSAMILNPEASATHNHRASPYIIDVVSDAH